MQAPMRFNYSSSGLTDVGQRRDHNEDALYLDDSLGIYIVADGMGGHAAGEVASATAIQAMSPFLHKSINDKDITWPFGFDTTMSRGANLLLSSIKLANAAVCNVAAERPECQGMGTTMVAALIEESNLIIGHVGDSRLYRFRGDTLELLTTDHTWVNEQLEKKVITEEEAKNHRWKNVITRALGNKTVVEVDLAKIEIEDQDLFMICSDGITTMLSDEEVRQEILHGGGNLDDLTERIVSLSNEKGGYDNITVIFVSFASPSSTPTVCL